MGFFLDWIPILLIFILIVAPISQLGFDPLWFGIVVAYASNFFFNTSFAVSIFYLKGTCTTQFQLKDIIGQPLL